LAKGNNSVGRLLALLRSGGCLLPGGQLEALCAITAACIILKYKYKKNLFSFYPFYMGKPSKIK
jgi:hypothetical protein